MADNDPSRMLEEVADFFSSKFIEHGDTPKGVEWNGEASQQVRFDQLIKIFDLNKSKEFSVNDLGCGYGALYDYIKDKYPNVAYNGYDISEPMIVEAKKRHGQFSGVRYYVSAKPVEMADYGVESGIFNMRLDCSDADWLRHIEKTLDMLDQTSRKGFAFNCLTSYSDADRMRPELYYADPLKMFDYCKRKYSRNVALLHDYGLYDFTILVRKDV